jgi:hypothetical protein
MSRPGSRADAGPPRPHARPPRSPRPRWAAAPPLDDERPDDRVGGSSSAWTSRAGGDGGRQPVTFSGFIDVGFFAWAATAPASCRTRPAALRRSPPRRGVRLGVPGRSALHPINTGASPRTSATRPASPAPTPSPRAGPGLHRNEVNLALRAGWRTAPWPPPASASPRSGPRLQHRRRFEVEFAQLEWMLGSARRPRSSGQDRSVIGIEYRERKSDRRYGHHPLDHRPLHHRHPVGIKLRSKLGESSGWSSRPRSTNGSSGIETFHFSDRDRQQRRQDRQRAPLGAPPFPFELELGALASTDPRITPSTAATPCVSSLRSAAARGGCS